MFPLSGTPAPVQNPGVQQFNTAIPQNVTLVTVTWPVAYAVAPTKISGQIIVPSATALGLTAELVAGTAGTTTAQFRLSGPVFITGYVIQVTVSP
jgi:hypothetical protein